MSEAIPPTDLSSPPAAMPVAPAEIAATGPDALSGPVLNNQAAGAAEAEPGTAPAPAPESLAPAPSDPAPPPDASELPPAAGAPESPTNPVPAQPAPEPPLPPVGDVQAGDLQVSPPPFDLAPRGPQIADLPPVPAIEEEASQQLQRILSGMKLSDQEKMIVDGAVRNLARLSVAAPFIAQQEGPIALVTLANLRDAELSSLNDIAVATGVETVTHVNQAITWALNRAVDFLLSRLTLI